MNVLEITHVPMDDPNIALYKREIKDTKKCKYAKNYTPHAIVKDKVL